MGWQECGIGPRQIQDSQTEVINKSAHKEGRLPEFYFQTNTFIPLLFLHVSEDSRIILRFLNLKNRLGYISCLFIIVPAQEREREQSIIITEDENISQM